MKMKEMEIVLDEIKNRYNELLEWAEEGISI